MRSAAEPRDRATAQVWSSSSPRQRWQIASTIAFLEGKNRYTLAGDILSSAAMSATAVLAKPRRRNSASAVSMIRARVSSGLILTCGFIALPLLTDEFHNSSRRSCQDAKSEQSIVLFILFEIVITAYQITTR